MKFSHFAALIALVPFAIAIPTAKGPSELVARSNDEARDIALVADGALAKREPEYTAVQARQVNVDDIIALVTTAIEAITGIFGSITNFLPAIVGLILSLVGSTASATGLLSGVVTITQAAVGSAVTAVQLAAILAATLPGVIFAP